MSDPKPHLQLSLQFVDTSHRAQLPRSFVARCLRATLLDTPLQLNVRIVGAEEGRLLNRDYRGKDYATNVLTFNYEAEPVVVADVILCAPVVAQEAKEQGIALPAHYAHLLVHGSLHAQGMDHETQRDALVMEAREGTLMRELGFDDPYRKAGSV
jgi:probable rRNA maturation factor